MKTVDVSPLLPKLVPLNLDVSQEISNRIDEIASQKNISREEVFAKALKLVSVAARAEASGGKLAIAKERVFGGYYIESVIEGF